MFGRGDLVSYTPIPGGIDNSNYFVALEKHGEVTDFVLTIMESHSFDEAPFFGKVLSHLNHYGLPVPAPQTTLDGMTSTIFCGKPTYLVKKLSGSHCTNAGEGQCRSIGEFIASQHNALSESGISRDNTYTIEWMRQTLASCADRLTPADVSLVETTIDVYDSLSSKGLPNGLIHGDLFRDNALFEDGALTGVIDYYRAGHDLLALDLSIAINDWCRSETEEPDATKQAAMIEGYESVRPLTEAESGALPRLQQVSAIRFALTRLLSGDPPLKDPAEMLNLARQYA